MTTSGSTDFNLTARQVVEFALLELNKINEREQPSPSAANRALRILNLMLKEWMKYENIWRLTEGSIAIAANTAGYRLTPAPYRIVDCRYQSADGRDVPMTQMTRQTYYELPLKQTTGLPTQWFFDHQRDTQSLYIWPVMAAPAGDKIRVTYQRRYEDVDSLNNDIDIPQEHLSVVGYNLAKRLGIGYGAASTPGYAVISQMADQLLGQALDVDREDFIEFVPDMR